MSQNDATHSIELYLHRPLVTISLCSNHDQNDACESIKVLLTACNIMTSWSQAPHYNGVPFANNRPNWEIRHCDTHSSLYFVAKHKKNWCFFIQQQRYAHDNKVHFSTNATQNSLAFKLRPTKHTLPHATSVASPKLLRSKLEDWIGKLRAKWMHTIGNHSNHICKTLLDAYVNHCQICRTAYCSSPDPHSHQKNMARHHP